jgi:hypothetical protein
VSVSARRVRTGRRVRLRVRVLLGGRPVRGALIRVAGARARTDRRGRAVIRKVFVRPGQRRMKVTRRGARSAVVVVRAVRR